MIDDVDRIEAKLLGVCAFCKKKEGWATGAIATTLGICDCLECVDCACRVALKNHDRCEGCEQVLCPECVRNDDLCCACEESHPFED